MLEAEIGGKVESVFAEFDWLPLASGSIGQTYRARLKSGDQVVVKVERSRRMYQERLRAALEASLPS